MPARFQSRQLIPSEAYVQVDGAELFCREIGEGRPIVVIHGGPDFDHTYLLPDMDRLADGYRLIYYDQRGRGKSRGHLKLDDISIERYVEDLDGLRKHLGLDRLAILGHSWGGHVAMQYALHRPERVSHLMLMNTAPASHDDYLRMRQERLRRRAPHEGVLNALASSSAFQEGDPDTVAEYYRIDYSTTFKRRGHLERLNLRWTKQDILQGRAIEDRLMEGLYWSEGFTIIPALGRLRMPTLIIHGDYDFVPIECATHIAGAISGARLVVVRDSGHFSYIDAPDEVRRAIGEFLDRAPSTA